jgi:broad specificity phosphatase PhoE
VRHAESFNNVLNLVSHDYYRAHRMADPILTPLGEEQANEVGKHIAEARSSLLQHISEVHVSPTVRTLETARPIVKRLPGVKVVVDVDIFEVGGVYNEGESGRIVGEPGLSRAKMAAFGYGLPDAVTESGWYNRGCDATAHRLKESKEEGKARAARVADRLRLLASSLDERRTIAMVSHGDFIGLLLADLISGQSGPEIAFKLYNTAISCVDIRADGSVLVLFVNTVAHLESRQYRAAHLGVV